VNKKLTSIGLLLILSMILSACSAKNASSDPVTSFREVTQSTLGPNSGKTPPVVPGFDGETISVGVVAPLSGLAGLLGQVLLDGAQTYWDEKNAQGGVAGKYKVDFLTKDSSSSEGYNKALAIQGYKELQPKVVAFQQVLGNDVVTALKKRQFEDKQIIMPSTLSSSWVRDPLTLSIANTYQTQAINGISYYVENSDKQDPNICTLSLDDSYGEEGLEGVEFASEKLGFEIKAKEQFTTLAPISVQVDKLIEAKCDAVFVSATAIDIPSVLSAFAENKSTATLIGLSGIWVPLIDVRLSEESRDYATNHLWVVSAGAKWGDESVPGMAKMMKAITTLRPKQTSNSFFMYGYAQAWALDQLLEKAVQNGDLTSAGVARALSNVGTFDFQGLLPSYKYGPNTSTRVVPPENTIFKYTRDDPSKLTPISEDAIDYKSEFVSKFKYPNK